MFVGYLGASSILTALHCFLVPPVRYQKAGACAPAERAHLTQQLPPQLPDSRARATQHQQPTSFHCAHSQPRTLRCNPLHRIQLLVAHNNRNPVLHQPNEQRADVLVVRLSPRHAVDEVAHGYNHCVSVLGVALDECHLGTVGLFAHCAVACIFSSASFSAINSAPKTKFLICTALAPVIRSSMHAAVVSRYRTYCKVGIFDFPTFVCSK